MNRNDQDNAAPLRYLAGIAESGEAVCSIEGSPYGPAFVVNDPSLVKQVLCNNNYVRARLLEMVIGKGLAAIEGPQWRQQRKLLQPEFFASRIGVFSRTISEQTDTMLDRWEQYAESGQSFDLADQMFRLTLRIITRIGFSTDVEDVEDALIHSIKIISKRVGQYAATLFGRTFDITTLNKEELRQAVDTLYDFADQLIQQRLSPGDEPNDLLSVMLAGMGQSCGNTADAEHLREEVVTFLIAGHESSAIMLSWACYLLASHPHYATLLAEELDHAHGQHVVGTEEQKLRWPGLILQETLRLYPPVWALQRRAVASESLGGTEIPAHAAVVISPYAMHRSPRYWPKPDQFFPERFEAEHSQERIGYTFFPFGGGPHHCVGKYFALMEGELILASIARRFRLHLIPGHPVEPYPALTLRMSDGLPVTLDRR